MAHRRAVKTHQISLGKSKFGDPVEVRRRIRSNRGLSTSGNLPVLIQQASLDKSVGFTERDWIGEIQIAAWFDDGDIHARGARVGDDLLDFGDGRVATQLLRFRGLVIDDPVPFAASTRVRY